MYPVPCQAPHAAAPVAVAVAAVVAALAARARAERLVLLATTGCAGAVVAAGAEPVSECEPKFAQVPLVARTLLGSALHYMGARLRPSSMPSLALAGAQTWQLVPAQALSGPTMLTACMATAQVGVTRCVGRWMLQH